MKKKLIRTDYMETKDSLSNGKTYVYKKSLGQKIGNGLFTFVACALGGAFAIQIVKTLINLFS